MEFLHYDNNKKNHILIIFVGEAGVLFPRQSVQSVYSV